MEAGVLVSWMNSWTEGHDFDLQNQWSEIRAVVC